ncbi:MAG: RNA polymerase sigma factor [Clostridia bacterium]|nr:RNA polymerase sigma factor [Clostridia bacterium]
MNNYSDKTDETLVELTLLGNDEAYEELVVRHEKAVKGTAYKVTGNSFSAEDASQDAFVAAWLHLDSLADHGKFKPWICAIAKNSAYELMESYRASFPCISLDTELINSDIPDDAWSEIERTSDVREAVSKLSEKIRETVELHYFEGYSIEEIARKLSLSEGTVKWRLSEGRRQLRKGYGTMEKEYNDKEALVDRVMREVERLKLWKLKSDKSGFEEEYRAVLKSVEALDDSQKKDHALADVLMMGYWWIDGERKRCIRNKIKALAEKSHNEEVMTEIIEIEIGEFYEGTIWGFSFGTGFDLFTWQSQAIAEGIVKIREFIENVEIPYLKEKGFKTAVGNIIRSLLEDILDNDVSTRLETLERSIKWLDPASIRYSAVDMALKQYNVLKESGWDLAKDKDISFVTGAIDLRSIDGNLCVWDEDAESFRYFDNRYIFSAFPDPTLALMQTDKYPFEMLRQVGDKAEYAYRSDIELVSTDETVETPSGRFDNCVLLQYTRNVYASNVSKIHYINAVLTNRAYICPGIGIVKHMVDMDGKHEEYLLQDYEVTGEGLIPLEVGNRWKYVFSTNDNENIDAYDETKVISAENGNYVVGYKFFQRSLGYEDSWKGDMSDYRKNSFRFDPESLTLIYNDSALRRALSRDLTKRQSIYLAIMDKVKRRVKETDPRSNKDCKEHGVWNWFDAWTVNKSENGDVILSDKSEYRFEYSPFLRCIEGQKLWYSHFLEILRDAAGAVWSHEWEPGYDKSVFRDVYGFKNCELRFHFVRDGETVTTPAGTFENCRHIQFDLRDVPGDYFPYAYRAGWMDYWFAPGVGIVQYFHLLNNSFDCYWQLTDYIGIGDGYFPFGDGFFRRYKPADLKDGFHASLELTYLADEDGAVIFADAAGTQDIEEYRKTSRVVVEENRASYERRKREEE